MEKISAKQYLSEIRRLRHNLKITQSMVDNCHINYNPMHAIDYSGDKVQSSPKNSLEDAAWKMLQASESAIAEQNRLATEINKRLGMIKSMKTVAYSEILYKHYYEYKPLDAISEEMGYGLGTITTYHGKALDEFARSFLWKRKN